MAPKGKTPSLIGGSLGRPQQSTAGRASPCSRCDAEIVRGEKCFDVPRLAKPHSSTRRFCAACFGAVLEQTKADLAKLEAL
jgi:hypothetical protein